MNEHKGRKILLATDTIETGFSGVNLYYVIDCLSFRSVSYDPLKKQSINMILPCCKNKTQ